METVYQVSNLVIALAYFQIPIALYLPLQEEAGRPPHPVDPHHVHHVHRALRPDAPERRVVFHWAPYRLFTLLFALTGAGLRGHRVQAAGRSSATW